MDAAQKFVEKWSGVQLSERAASHEHFIDLCRLLGQPTPAEADPTGENYCFEKAVKVVGVASTGFKGEGGFVDVWKRGCFGWEYKRKDRYKNLDAPYLSADLPKIVSDLHEALKLLGINWRTKRRIAQ